MSMSPDNYVGIEEKYNEIKDRINYITDERNPISFPLNNVDESKEVSALEERIGRALRNLSSDSLEKEKYQQMLISTKRLGDKLCLLLKRDLDNRLK